MEDVTLAGLGQPQESLAAEQSRWAAGVEEAWNRLTENGRSLSKDSETKPSSCRCPCPCVIVPRVPGRNRSTSRIGAAGRRSASCARAARLRSANGSSLRPCRAGPRGPVAFVQKDGVGIAQLVARRDAVEAVEAELLGIGHRDDGVEAKRVAEFRALEGSATGNGSATPVVSTMM